MLADSTAAVAALLRFMLCWRGWACTGQKALATANGDENLWRPAFEIWPALLGPTRAAAWREGELLFLDFEGSSDAAVGLCYNPRHLQHRDCSTPLGGPWYRYHS